MNEIKTPMDTEEIARLKLADILNERINKSKLNALKLGFAQVIIEAFAASTLSFDPGGTVAIAINGATVPIMVPLLVKSLNNARQSKNNLAKVESGELDNYSEILEKVNTIIENNNENETYQSSRHR